MLMRQIGSVKQLQIQLASLKVGEKPDRRYDPTPLLAVEKLYLDRNGAVGQSFDGERIVDLHNSTHPLSHNRGENEISISFSSHYQAIRDRFGAHSADGCAGENILVETAIEQTLAELVHGLVIQSKQTGEYIHLTDILAATPCVEFSHFVLREPQASSKQIKETLQFLHYGRRGFYARLADGQEEGIVEVGDVVFVLDGEEL